MTIVHDKRHLDPDWERWAKKGLAQESVYSLRFVYLFTQADREKERQMLAGKSDEERVQLETDIVNQKKVHSCYRRAGHETDCLHG